MIVDENTKFIPWGDHRPEIYYALPNKEELEILWELPDYIIPSYRRARFHEYGEQKLFPDGQVRVIGRYRVALCPEINTVYFQIGL